MAKQRKLVWSLLLGVSTFLAPPVGQADPRSFDPDPQACKEDMIRTTFRANLLPWIDQPEAVQQRLRQLQAAMTLDTLRECQARGLLRADQVNALTVELALPTGTELGTKLGTAPGSPAQSPARP